MNTKIVAGLLVVALLAIGGGIGYFEWRQHQVPVTLLPHLKSTTLRLANSLGYELQPSNVTYGELFESIGKHVTEIDSKIIDVQTLETLRIGRRLTLCSATCAAYKKFFVHSR